MHDSSYMTGILSTQPPNLRFEFWRHKGGFKCISCIMAVVNIIVMDSGLLTGVRAQSFWQLFGNAPFRRR